MRKPEQKIYDRLKVNMPQPGDRIDRVENVLVFGMPDVNFCAEGIECWIELKAPTEPKKDKTPLFGSNHKLSIEQMNWLFKQVGAGGRCFILIGTDKRWLLIDGFYADYINTLTITELEDIALWKAKSPVIGCNRWADLRQALINTNLNT